MNTTVEKITTEKEALHAVSLNPDSLTDIPKEFLTKKVCEQAFEQYPYKRILRLIPFELRTFDMVLKGAPDYGSETKEYAHWALPVEWGISDSAFVALVKKGTLPNLKKVTDPNIIASVWLKVLACDVSAIKDQSFPSYVIDLISEIQAIKIAQEGLIQYLPEDKITEIVLQTYQNRFDGNLTTVPEQYLTYEMCKRSVEKNSSQIANVPEDFMSEELCEIAIESSGDRIKLLPEAYKAKFYVMTAKKGYGFEGIPEADRTDKLCAIAVEARGENLEFVPQDKKSYSIVLSAVDKNAGAYAFIPEDLEDDDHEVKIRTLITYFSERHAYKAEDVIEEMLKKFNYASDRAELVVEVMKRRPDLFGQVAECANRNTIFRDAFLRLEVCIEAFNGNKSNTKYVPQSVIQDVFAHYIQLKERK